MWSGADNYNLTGGEFCSDWLKIGYESIYTCLPEGLFFCVDPSGKDTVLSLVPAEFPIQVNCDLEGDEANHCADLAEQKDQILENEEGWSWERERLERVDLDGTITCRADFQYNSSASQQEYCQMTLLEDVKAVHCGNSPLTTKL